ncbi:MFS transporter [Nocardioides nanhaiensis]|uniref:MFS transporter n=1 Tax=Nocardioides nanhaiensis TaxID=1476871 RepID=A0ABP8W8B8_9ACTN
MTIDSPDLGGPRAYVATSSSDDGYRPPPRGGAYENIVLAVLFATFGFVFFDRLALNFLSPFFKDELGLSNSDIGLLGGIPALAWALSGLTMGYLSDRVDRRKPFLVAAIVLFTAFSALSGLVGGLGSLLLLRAVMGGAEGAVLPLAQPMMIYSSSPKRRGLNMGLVQGSSAGLLGGVLGPIVTVALAEAYGWRVAFLATVVPGLLLAGLVLLLVKDLRLQHPATIAQDRADQVPVESPERAAMTLRDAVRTRNVALCLAISVFYLTWFTTTQTFAPLYLSEVKGFTGGQLSSALAGIGVAWVVWGALVPGISDRIGRRPAMIGFSVLAVVAPLAVVSIDSPGLLFLTLAVTYTGLGCFTLMMATIPAETVPRHLVATCLGLIMGVGEIMGGFIAPWLAGVLSDSFGLQVSMFISSGAAVVVVVLSFGLRETAPSRVGVA